MKKQIKTYQETLGFMFSQLPMFQNQGSKAFNNKLDKSLALDDYFQQPHKTYQTIHVGGTNGKGSVSHLLASVLQSSGYKVGLYTSPHLKDFRERIKVNGMPCSKEFVVDFIEKHTEILQKLRPSFFEMTVAMAFQYFKEQEVDIAIIEVGLGGRLDSTNIISPILSVITNISKDHTAMLGNSLPEIASEKAGIIKPNTPVIIGEYQKEVATIFEEKAKEKNAPIVFADREQQLVNCEKTNTKLRFDWRELKSLQCPLRTDYQKKNINTALTTIEYLNEKNLLKISEKALREGIEKVVEQTQFLGRWQVICEKPLTICETGHNEVGIRMAMQELKQLDYEKAHIVLGVSNDKDLASVLPLFPKKAQYYFTQAKVLRAMPATMLQEKAEAFQLFGNAYDSVTDAIKSARENATENDLIYIGGSIFIVAEAI